MTIHVMPTKVTNGEAKISAKSNQRFKLADLVMFRDQPARVIGRTFAEVTKYDVMLLGCDDIYNNVDADDLSLT